MFGLGAAPVAKVAEVQVAVAPLYAHFVERIRVASVSVEMAAQNDGTGRSFHAVTRVVQAVVFVEAQVALESSEAVGARISRWYCEVRKESASVEQGRSFVGWHLTIGSSDREA
jgi:hypothetical protein